MTALREAAQQALNYWESASFGDAVMVDKMDALRAALAQQAEPEGGGNLPPPLQVPNDVAAILTTTDIAWLETRRLTKLWQELGQMRWAGGVK